MIIRLGGLSIALPPSGEPVVEAPEVSSRPPAVVSRPPAVPTTSDASTKKPFMTFKQIDSGKIKGNRL